MKKRGRMVFIMLLLFCLTACGNAGISEKEEETPNAGVSEPEESESLTQEEEMQNSGTDGSADAEEQEDNMNTKTLVVYFSCTGTTEPLAEYAAESLGADLYEIIPEEPYTEEDLAYYTNGRADKEQNDPSVRPAISGSVENMEVYDTVVLGYPIWHGQAPRIISTFLESYDFSGKTIVPFCTSHSSGIGSSASDLHSLCPDSVKWLDGKRFGGGTSKEEIEGWLRGIGIL